MRRVDVLLAEYGESHQNPVNKRVHWICVPVIFTCVVGFLWSLPPIGSVNWLWVVAPLTLLYYLALSPRLAAGFVVVLALALAALWLVARLVPLPLWQTVVLLFVLAWIGQFWGHKVEGKRPSFFKDLQFLLIGPAWLLSFVYRRLGIGW
jgi:uncharacterized membrane protein YGL010W